MKLIHFTLVFCFLAFNLFAQTATIYRKKVALSPVYGTIKAAIAVMHDSDSIVLSPHVFFEHDIEVLNSKHVTIKGVPDKTIIDAQGLGRGIYVNNFVDFNLQDIIITNGNSLDFGGGIYFDKAKFGSGAEFEVKLTGKNVIKNCKSKRGGGIYSKDGFAVYGHCTISANEADFGGGIFLYEGQIKFYEDSLFIIGNRAIDGGGVMCLEEGSGGFSARMGSLGKYVLVSGNSATRNGGAFYGLGIGGNKIFIRDNNAIKGAAGYGSGGFGYCNVYNPRPDGTRQNEFYYANMGYNNLTINECWLGSNDTSGLFSQDVAATGHFNLLRWVKVNWEANNGIPIGPALASFPVKASFKLNTGDTIIVKNFPMMDGRFFASFGSFSPAKAPMKADNTFSSTYTAPGKGFTNLMAVIDADTFRLNLAVLGINEIGFEAVKIFPNPAKDMIYISGAEEGSVITVYSIQYSGGSSQDTGDREQWAGVRRQ